MVCSYPLFFWVLSIGILNCLINAEENGPEIYFLIRNNIAVMAILFSFILINKIISIFRTRKDA